MIQARFNVFETNSSSTHALAILPDTDGIRWRTGDYVCFNNYFLGIKSREEVVDMLFDKDSKEGEAMRDVVNTDFTDLSFKEVDGKIQLFDEPFETPVSEEEIHDRLEEIFDDLDITCRDDIGEKADLENAEEICDDVQGANNRKYVIVGYFIPFR